MRIRSRAKRGNEGTRERGNENALTAGACERDIIEQTLNESVKSRSHRFACFATPVLWRKQRYTRPSRLIVPGVERKALQRFSGKKEAADAAAHAVEC